jgi:hypothetical protein
VLVHRECSGAETLTLTRPEGPRRARGIAASYAGEFKIRPTAGRDTPAAADGRPKPTKDEVCYKLVIPHHSSSFLIIPGAHTTRKDESRTRNDEK